MKSNRNGKLNSKPHEKGIPNTMNREKASKAHMNYGIWLWPCKNKCQDFQNFQGITSIKPRENKALD